MIEDQLTRISDTSTDVCLSTCDCDTSQLQSSVCQDIESAIVQLTDIDDCVTGPLANNPKSIGDIQITCTRSIPSQIQNKRSRTDALDKDSRPIAFVRFNTS